jgi:aromatic-L-amino-acid/L-tryptophan decarboxylase
MTAFPLEPSENEMQAVGQAALQFAADYVTARGHAPATDVDSAAWLLAERLGHTLPPEEGGDFSALLGLIGAAAGKSVDTTGPGYLAFVPGGGLYTSAIANLLASVTNRYIGLAALTPPMVAIEESVLRWLCTLFGYDDRARGILTSGGSMANFSAMVAARTVQLDREFVNGTLYVSEHTHRSVAKAAMLAGLPRDAVRGIACTRDLAMDPRALESTVVADRAAGRHPFFVVATAGTTNTGAVDPIDRLADIAARHGLWLHVDAAYGGFFQLTERGRARFGGIHRADSITLDPHKAMFLPYGTGCLLMRDGDLLRRGHEIDAPYLQDVAGHYDLPNYADYSPELTRENRGLRMWLPLHLHGVAAFRAALDEKLDLARVVYEGLTGDEQMDVPWEPPLSTVVFRLRDRDDAVNRALLDRINTSKRIVLSSTILGNSFYLRVCVLAHRTHRDRVDEAVHIIRTAALDL